MAGGLMATVRAQFTATAAGFHSAISQIVNDTHSIGTSTQNAVGHANSSYQSLRGMIGKLGGAYLAFQGVTAGLAGLGKATIGANADMETYENTLTTLMGSHKKAVETLDWAVKFAAATPFEIPQIVDATAKLTSYGINAKDVLTDIGNMASIMGKPLDAAVEAVADAQTGELERLKEFGITKQMLIDEAQKLYGKELVNTKGQITDQELLNKTLFAIMKDRYSGGMDIASKSFKGIVSNIQDAFGSMARELSKPIFEKLKTGLATIAPIMSATVQAIQGDWKGVKETLGGAFGPDTALQIENFFLKIGSGVNEAKQYFLDFKPTIENLKTIFKNLGPVAGDAFKLIGGAIIAAAEAIQAILQPVTDLAAKLTSWEGFIPMLYGMVAAAGSFKGMIALITQAQALYDKVVAISTAVQGAWTAAMAASAAAGGGLRGVMAGMRAAAVALNLTMLANPFVLIAALIIGLGVALYTAYQKSETFRNAVNAVGGAIKSGFMTALEWLKNFFTVTIPAMWESTKTWFTGIWNWLVAFFSKWGTTILAVVAPFIGIPLLIYQHWDQIKAWLVGVWNAVVAMVMPIINGFIDGVKTGFNNFKTNIMTIIDPLINFFSETWENIKLLVLSIVGVFLNLLLGRFDDVKIALRGIWEAIKRQFESTIKVIKDVGLAIFNILANGIGKIWDGVKKTASTVWNAIKTTIVNVWNGLKTSVVNTANALKNGAVNAWNALKTGAINAVNNLKTGAINAFNSLKSGATTAVSNTKTAIVNGFNNAKTAAVNAVTNMYNTVVSWFKKIPAKASETASNLKSKFSNINLTSIGRNIIQGLLNGITGMAKKVWDKANSIADGITSRIKKALSIHSPSRVMAEMGAYTGEGLIVGMESMRQKVQGMAGKLASAIQTPISGNFIANAGSAVMESIQTIKHVFDLQNVPSHIDENTLVDILAKSVGNPKLQKTIDRINYKNNKGVKMPLGRA